MQVDAGLSDAKVTAGHNLKAVLADLEQQMRAAASDLNFEEAARLRDEVKRLNAVALAVSDDPLARPEALETQMAVSAGRSAGRTQKPQRGKRRR